VNLGRGAALERVQDGGKSAVAPLSRSARTGLLPDWPAGFLRTELVATHNTAVNVLMPQGGGTKGCAPSHFVQAPVPSWQPWTRPRNSEAGRGERGGHDRLEPVGGDE
jgi:hypothetical protein